MNKKIIISVLAGGSEHYEQMEAAARETCFKNPPDNISVYYVHNRKEGVNIEDDETKLIDDCFYYGVSDVDCKHLLRKCVLFWGYCLENFDFDYIFRPNLGCWVSMAALNKLIETLPIRGIYGGFFGTCRKIPFVSGSGFLLSRDLVELIWDYHLNDKDIAIEYDGNSLIDDVAIGAFLAAKKVERIKLPRIDLHESQIIDSIINPSCHHYYFLHSKSPNCYYKMQEAINNYKSSITTAKYPDITLAKEEGVFDKITQHEISFCKMRDVYLGSADPVHISQKHSEKIKDAFVDNSNVFSTCGGFLSLNVLNCFVDFQVNNLTFFDINPYSVDFARYVVKLIKNSNDILSFLEKYLMLHVKELRGEYILLPTSQEERDRIFEENNKHHNHTSSSIFYAVSKSPYDKDRVYLLGFMHIGGDRVGELILKPRDDNTYIYQNTLGVGSGWLYSNKSFLSMKRFLNSVDINFLAAGINDIDCDFGDTIIASNISAFQDIKTQCNIVHANKDGHFLERRFTRTSFYAKTINYKKPKDVDRKKTKVVYTVIVGDVDILKEPEVISDGWDYVCFTDVEHIQTEDSAWDFRPIPTAYHNEDKKRTASLLKIEFYKLFNNSYDLVVYIDATTKIKKNLDTFIKQQVTTRYDMAAIKHINRNCIYDEARIVSDVLKTAEKDITVEQISRYKKENYPKQNGLICGAFLVRHNREGVRRACEIWSSEYRSGCRRDQVSLTYAFWKAAQMGYQNIILLLNHRDVYNGHYFDFTSHKSSYSWYQV